MNYMGKTLIIFGIFLVILGFFFIFGAKVPWLGKLPGDIIIQRKNFSFYFPITASIIISIVLSFIFFLFFRR